MTSPPSYLKPQLQSLASLPVGVPELSATAALPIMQPVLLPKTPRKRTGPRKGFKSLGFPIISNSPDNTYDMALLLRVSPQTPGHPLQEAHYDILFVRSLSSSAVECVEYQDLPYNYKENQSLSPLPTSDVPSSFPTYRKESIPYVRKRDQQLMRVPHRV